jgi:hypothetical protein
MTFFTIDTLQFSKRLQKAGLEQRIADEFAEAIKDTQNQTIQGLATKEDVKIVEQKIESLEHKLTVKMFLMITAAVAIIAWLDKVIN